LSAYAGTACTNTDDTTRASTKHTTRALAWKGDRILPEEYGFFIGVPPRLNFRTEGSFGSIEFDEYLELSQILLK
jgi:hypothetical protein